MRKWLSPALRVALLAVLVPAAATGCRTAAVAGAGAAAAVMLTDQGAESLVQGTISDVDRRTRTVLRNMGMQLTDAAYEDNATEREYEARAGDRVVHVKLESRGGTTQVNVSSREGRTDYDKDHAREIISRIQQQR